MKISDNQLSQNASVYVKDGVLTKWRGNGMSLAEFNEFNDARINKTPLTDSQLERLKRLDRVVFDNKNHLLLVNFSGVVLKY